MNGWADFELRPQTVSIKNMKGGLEEQLSNGLNDETIISKIKKELRTLKDMREVSSDQV